MNSLFTFKTAVCHKVVPLAHPLDYVCTSAMANLSFILNLNPLAPVFHHNILISQPILLKVRNLTKHVRLKKGKLLNN